jgi:peptidyl-prolyl cis-trans isomerase D
MALIGQIRKHSGLLVVVIGVALAAFVLGDFLKPSQQRQDMYIGEIGGIEITSQEFFQKVNEQEQVTKEQRKTEKLEAQDLFQIKQSVWNQFVQEIIMAEEYLRLGLTVTSEELSEQILGENPHKYVQQSFTNPNTQKYDPEMVKSFLQNLDGQSADMRRRYLSLETMVKEDRLKTKYNTLITKAYSIPEAFAELDYINNNRKVDFRFVAPKFSLVADSLVSITDEDLRKYYKEHEYNYKQEEVRSIDYVTFDVVPSKEDRQNIANEVNKLYEEFKTTDDDKLFVNSVSDNRYDSTYKKESELQARIAKEMFESPVGTIVGPYIENEIYNIAKLVDRQERVDSIMMSQLLVSYATAPSGMNLSERTKDEAEVLVDSLLNVIEKNPSKFEELTVEFSNYPNAADDKGDLGWIVDGNPGFALFYTEAADVKVGGVKKMETALGYHIIKVAEKTQPIEKVRVAIVTRAIEPSNETFQETYLKASTFAGENPTLAQFDTAVVNQGLNKRSADRLNEMSNRIAGIDYPRQVIQWAFIDQEVGTVSRVFQNEKSYFVAVLKDVVPEGITPFDNVKEQIRPLVLNSKKSEVLVDRINALNTDDLYKIASAMDEKVDTATDISFMARNIPGFGREGEVIGKLMTLETGITSEPIKGNNAVFVVYIDEIKEPKEIDVYSIYANQLEAAFKNKITANAPYKALEEKTEIVDNRLLYY